MTRLAELRTVAGITQQELGAAERREAGNHQPDRER